MKSFLLYLFFREIFLAIKVWSAKQKSSFLCKVSAHASQRFWLSFLDMLETVAYLCWWVNRQWKPDIFVVTHVFAISIHFTIIFILFAIHRGPMWMYNKINILMKIFHGSSASRQPINLINESIDVTHKRKDTYARNHMLILNFPMHVLCQNNYCSNDQLIHTFNGIIYS